MDQLWDEARGAFGQERTWRRARTLGLAALSCLGRRTISGILCATGQQFSDWSSAYRLFERERIDERALFAPVLQAVAQVQGPQSPLFAAMDDTLLRKRGRKVYGAGHWRDPLGPKFRTNLVWAQRFMQVSLMVPEDTTQAATAARAVPIQLTHAPVPKKPHPRADPALHEAYRQKKHASRISALGTQQLHALRQRMDQTQATAQRQLITCVDGGLTNRTVWRNIPERTVLVGRVRKDAKIFALPDPNPSPRGRRRLYGQRLPTPEQLRQDPSIAWQHVPVHVGGKLHMAQVKTVDCIRWQSAAGRDLRLLIVRPLKYRHSPNAPLQHHDPLYLLCSDTNLDLQTILQAYAWRWQIEVNFREEKTLLGVGQAQVRTPTAVAAVPNLIVAAYSFLLLAARGLQQRHALLPPPKWQRPKPHHRPSCAQLIATVRAELWATGLGIDHLTHFAKTSMTKRSHFFKTKPLAAAVCYASK